MIQIEIEIGIAIEIEKEMGRRHADWMSIDMGNWKTGNRLLPFCQPVIPIYIVDSDFDPDFDKPELHAITLGPRVTAFGFSAFLSPSKRNAFECQILNDKCRMVDFCSI
ncbi:hypothetical protein DSCOOX_22990 [Desulfosarcina ovata subsp. ovata]|uniref:Uncharacterized protein n=1 Tax=Desulfosarcina ovata subsp. ovata TaxID=2752305 RepID=A0A5K8A9G2_9BACT|nr:hypothetical protein DSCOOX_22990 [Desulfosarcina ovata subsp. ovata]